FKKSSAAFVQQTFFEEDMSKKDQNYQKAKKFELIESAITSLPVQNYIFKNLTEEVKVFTIKEVFITQKEYSTFFYQMHRKYPALRAKVEETINRRYEHKSSI